MRYKIAMGDTKFTPDLLRKIKKEADRERLKSIKGLEFEFYPNGEKGHFIKVFIPKEEKVFSQMFCFAYGPEYKTVDIPVSFRDEGNHILVGYKNELRQKKRG